MRQNNSTFKLGDVFSFKKVKSSTSSAIAPALPVTSSNFSLSQNSRSQPSQELFNHSNTGSVSTSNPMAFDSSMEMSLSQNNNNLINGHHPFSQQQYQQNKEAKIEPSAAFHAAESNNMQYSNSNNSKFAPNRPHHFERQQHHHLNNENISFDNQSQASRIQQAQSNVSLSDFQNLKMSIETTGFRVAKIESDLKLLSKEESSKSEYWMRQFEKVFTLLQNFSQNSSEQSQTLSQSIKLVEEKLSKNLACSISNQDLCRDLGKHAQLTLDKLQKCSKTWDTTLKQLKGHVTQKVSQGLEKCLKSSHELSKKVESNKKDIVAEYGKMAQSIEKNIEKIAQSCSEMKQAEIKVAKPHGETNSKKPQQKTTREALLLPTDTPKALLRMHNNNNNSNMLRGENKCVEYSPEDLSRIMKKTAFDMVKKQSQKYPQSRYQTSESSSSSESFLESAKRPTRGGNITINSRKFPKRPTAVIGNTGGGRKLINYNQMHSKTLLHQLISGQHEE